ARPHRAAVTARAGQRGDRIGDPMSAFGPKQTWTSATHMSAFGGKADMPFCGCLLSRSLLGVKRTSLFAAHMSAFDPKRAPSLSILDHRPTRLQTPQLRQ